MRVNRLWREHAMNHPTYFGDLELIKHYLDDPAFFLLRMSRSAGRPISIKVNVDLDEEMPLSLMHEIGEHLYHVTSLALCITSRHSVAAVLRPLCRPAPILRNLNLHVDVAEATRTALPSPSRCTLPAEFLAGHGPALYSVTLTGIELSSTGRSLQCFSKCRVLSFYSAHWGALILPSPFEHCPDLEKLHLGNRVRLHPDARGALHGLKKVVFVGYDVAHRWPDFGFPLDELQTIKVKCGNAASALALADTLALPVGGPLHLAFLPPYRPPPVPCDPNPSAYYKVVMRSGTGSTSQSLDRRSRVVEGFLSDSDSEEQSLSAFSMRSLTDRVVRVELTLEAWDDFVGQSFFGPFDAMQELVLNVKDSSESELTRTGSTGSTARPKLFCPKLQQLVLRGTFPAQVSGIAVRAVADFAVAALYGAQFPLRLGLDGIELVGTWEDVPQTFSGCIGR